MAVFKWRRRPTKYFGETWVPIAQVEIGGSDGRFQTFALQLDSGAVISLLRRSVADVLGLNLEAGRRIELTSVGGASTLAYVHELPTRFDDHLAFAVPFAIAESESVPTLLGRLAVFDRLQIAFDPTFEETLVTAPWLIEDDRKIWEFVLETERHILSRWSELNLPPPVRQVARRFVNRGAKLVAGTAGLLKLHRRYAGLALVRPLFELALQFEYLMRDPLVRAQRYLDYGTVTRYRYMTALIDQPSGPISTSLANSPQRKTGESRSRAEFDRVRAQFTKKDAKGRERLSPNWYGSSIAQLAKDVGWDGEYRLWYAMGSGWAHGDPFSTEDNPLHDGLAPHVLLLTVLGYYARILLRVSEHLILTAEQYEGLRTLAEGSS